MLIHLLIWSLLSTYTSRYFIRYLIKFEVNRDVLMCNNIFLSLPTTSGYLLQ